MTRLIDLITHYKYFVFNNQEKKSIVTGISTGFMDLDNMTSGLHPGNLITVGGCTSVGKTSFALNISLSISYKSKAPVVFITMDSTRDEIMYRLISLCTHIDLLQIKTGCICDEDIQKIKSCINLLQKSNLIIENINSLENIAFFCNKTHEDCGQKLGLIVIDYLQLLTVKTENQHPRSVQLGEITRSLKALAVHLQVPILAISQLNRELNYRENHRPLINDFLDSGSIENDSDVIIFIYRDEIYNENSPDKGIAEIIVAKQRRGPIGKIRLTFKPPYGVYENFIHGS